MKALALLLFVIAGCGPVAYVNQVTREASSEVAAARSVNAEKWAPYYFTRAVEYLRKAREEASRADFQAATRFGRTAAADANKAKELAVARSAKGELPGPPTTEGKPAKSTDDSDDSDDSDGPIEDASEAGGG